MDFNLDLMECAGEVIGSGSLESRDDVVKMRVVRLWEDSRNRCMSIPDLPDELENLSLLCEIGRQYSNWLRKFLEPQAFNIETIDVSLILFFEYLARMDLAVLLSEQRHAVIKGGMECCVSLAMKLHETRNRRIQSTKHDAEIEVLKLTEVDMLKLIDDRMLWQYLAVSPTIVACEMVEAWAPSEKRATVCALAGERVKFMINNGVTLFAGGHVVAVVALLMAVWEEHRTLCDVLTTTHPAVRAAVKLTSQTDETGHLSIYHTLVMCAKYGENINLVRGTLVALKQWVQNEHHKSVTSPHAFCSKAPEISFCHSGPSDAMKVSGRKRLHKTSSPTSVAGVAEV